MNGSKMVPRAWYAFGAAILVSMVCRIVPLSPLMPAAGLDPSWRYAINQALAQGLVFGRDIVFTLGPYASIYTTVYHPDTAALITGVSLYFALSYGALLIFLGYRQRWWMPVLLIILLIVTAPSAGDILFFLYALLACLAVVELDRTAGEPSGKQQHLPMLLLALLPFGLLPLIKGSFLIISGVAIIGTAGFLCYRARYSQAIVALATPILGLVFFWLLAEQPPDALLSYMGASFWTISGYTEAMAIPGWLSEIWLYLGAAVILVLSVITAHFPRPAARGYVSIVLTASMFLAFKAGFVRHDAHAMAATSFPILCALALAPILKMPQRVVSIAVATALILISMNYYTRVTIPAVASIFYNTYAQAFRGVKFRLSHSNGLVSRFDAVVAKIGQKSNLPKFDGTADIYSYNQSDLLAAGNMWDPRPVMQSYAAYTPDLLNLNAQHLYSDNAPDHLVFRIEPIDGRLPSMEDGASWPRILTDYHPVGLEDSSLFLEKNTERANVDERRIGAGYYSLGDSVVVPESSDPVFAEIDIRPTIIGRIVNMLYKPPLLRIELTLTDGTKRTYRLVSGMTKTGILVSPMVENTMEFALMYGGRNILVQKRVSSFRVLSSSREYEWKRRYAVSFKSVMVPSYGGVRKLIKFDSAFHVPADAAISDGLSCEGGIDTINGTTPPAVASLGTFGWLDMSGWLAISSARGTVPKKKLIVLTDGAGKRTFFQARSLARPDVGTYFGKPQLAAAGYAAVIDISQLVGKYTLGLAYFDKNMLGICSIAIPIDKSHTSDASRQSDGMY